MMRHGLEKVFRRSMFEGVRFYPGDRALVNGPPYPMLEAATDEERMRRKPLFVDVPCPAGTGVGLTTGQRIGPKPRKHDEHFRSGCEFAPLGVALIGLEGRFLQVNQTFCDHTGHSRENLLASRVQDIIHPQDLESDLVNIRQILTGEIPSYQAEMRIVPGDGRVVWPLLTAFLVRSDAGEPLYGILQVQDTTERKRHDLAQRLMAETGVLLESSLDLVATLTRVVQLHVPALADWCEIDVLDLDGQGERVEIGSVDPERGRILRTFLAASPFATSRYGGMIARVVHSRESMVVRDVTDAMLEAWAEDSDQAAQIQGLGVRSFMVVPLIARGRTLGVLVFASTDLARRYDAHDVKLAEALAHRAALAVDNAHRYQVANDAARHRDEVLRVVAHDLRVPLSSISLAAQLLRRRLGVPEIEKLERIMRAVDRAGRLIQDLMDVGRMGASQLTVHQQSEDAGSLARDCLEGQRMLAEAKSLGIKVEIATGLPSILADRHRLLQILSNLIANAIKFTPEGGDITLRVEDAGDMVRFSVADTGPGIRREDVPRLFEAFWQAQKGRSDGAGLGLSIVKGLVEAHGGHVQVESTPGSGSTFSFTIPHAHPSRISASTF